MKQPRQAMPLTGKTILITRQREQSEDFLNAIQDRGGKACVIPLIRIVAPESWVACDKAIAQLASYNGLIMTSGNAVEKFLTRCELHRILSTSFENIEVYAVGMRTAEWLREFGLHVTFSPTEFTSAALQVYFERESVRGKRFLMPRGNLTKEDLPEFLRSLGAVVDEVDVYQNASPSAETLEELSARFLNGEFDVVTFASPSAIRNFRKGVIPSLFDLGRNRTRLAVIGPTTCVAAKELGYTVDIEAKEFTGKGLVDAIVQYYSQR